MSNYLATIKWQRKENEDFANNEFSRHHVWEFDGGFSVPASASPHIVAPPFSVEENVDPEEAFVAALSSCHMLWFLGIAAKRKYVLDDYFDESDGIMAENEQGKLAMTRVTLRPKVRFSGSRLPSRENIEKMHHLAHENCFIANSVKTDVVVEPIYDD